MYKVGLTGGIGSGKSLVSEVFKHLNIPVYQADNIAKRLYNTDYLLRKQMIDLFGAGLYKNNLLDRKMLATIIFNDKKALNTVNHLVHPAVERDFNHWASQQISSYIIHEAAILFESGVDNNMDKTITISAPEELRITRASRRDKVAPIEIIQRISNQITDDERNLLADFIIISNDIQPMLPQILSIHKVIISISQSIR